jgi:hypothetical protein
MDQNGLFGHINSLGEDPMARAIRYGYPVSKKTGEILKNFQVFEF